MDITRAYEILYTYYDKYEINSSCKREKLTSTEVDTIKKYKVYAALLLGVLDGRTKLDDDARKEILDAIYVFNSEYDRQMSNI